MNISTEDLAVLHARWKADAKQEIEKHRKAGLCMMYTQDTELCGNLVALNGICTWHASPRCRAKTTEGKRCQNRSFRGSKGCILHYGGVPA